MKIIYVFFLSLICFHLCACSKNDEMEQPENPTTISSAKMKITIGSTVFTATLYDNSTANAFKEILPLTINMSDLNANEKFYNFPTTFPVNSSTVGNIQLGDLMLYGNNCLVLFYESFNTSYTYSRIGKIDNVSGLATALGAGNVTVKFENN